MLRIGRGVDRKAVREGLARDGALTVVYDDTLTAEDIREALAGIRDAGLPQDAVALLAWLASHPNAPEDVLRELFELGGRTILVGLALNRKLPEELRRALLEHPDDDVRDHAESAQRRFARG